LISFVWFKGQHKLGRIIIEEERRSEPIEDVVQEIATAGALPGAFQNVPR
jgi:hypothetical protein